MSDNMWDMELPKNHIEESKDTLWPNTGIPMIYGTAGDFDNDTGISDIFWKSSRSIGNWGDSIMTQNLTPSQILDRYNDVLSNQQREEMARRSREPMWPIHEEALPRRGAIDQPGIWEQLSHKYYGGIDPRTEEPAQEANIQVYTANSGMELWQDAAQKEVTLQTGRNGFEMDEDLKREYNQFIATPDIPQQVLRTRRNKSRN